MSALISNDELSLPARIASASRRPKGLGLQPAGSISLAMGEPDDPTAPRVVDAAVAALRAGRTHYAPLTGAPDLRAALADRTERTSGRPTTAAEVVPTHGGSAALAATMMALVRPGDRVLVPEPTYSLYVDHLAMIGAEALWVPHRADGTIDLARIEELAPGARMLVLCHPSNPTGGVLTGAQLTDLAGILSRHPELLLLSDEAYSEIVYDEAPFVSALSLQEVREQIIGVGTFSKSFSMTGWRLGYVIAPSGHAEQINLVHRTILGALNTFVQDAAMAALSTPEAELDGMRARYQRRRDLVMERLEQMDGVSVIPPAGAFYAFPRIVSELSSLELVERFASGGVLVRAGTEFGPSGEGHVRLSFATDEESLDEGLRRFGEVVTAL